MGGGTFLKSLLDQLCPGGGINPYCLLPSPTYPSPSSPSPPLPPLPQLAEARAKLGGNTDPQPSFHPSTSACSYPLFPFPQLPLLPLPSSKPSWQRHAPSWGATPTLKPGASCTSPRPGAPPPSQGTGLSRGWGNTCIACRRRRWGVGCSGVADAYYWEALVAACCQQNAGAGFAGAG